MTRRRRKHPRHTSKLGDPHPPGSKATAKGTGVTVEDGEVEQAAGAPPREGAWISDLTGGQRLCRHDNHVVSRLSSLETRGSGHRQRLVENDNALSRRPARCSRDGIARLSGSALVLEFRGCPAASDAGSRACGRHRSAAAAPATATHRRPSRPLGGDRATAQPRTGGDARWRNCARSACRSRPPRRINTARRHLRRRLGVPAPKLRVDKRSASVTDLGNIRLVLVLALVLASVELLRRRSRWSFLFLFAVLAGEEVASAAVKGLVGRVRPALTAEAATLGPSFPSGHSAAAAAFYAAAALVIGRNLAAARGIC